MALHSFAVACRLLLVLSCFAPLGVSHLLCLSTRRFTPRILRFNVSPLFLLMAMNVILAAHNLQRDLKPPNETLWHTHEYELHLHIISSTQSTSNNPINTKNVKKAAEPPPTVASTAALSSNITMKTNCVFLLSTLASSAAFVVQPSMNLSSTQLHAQSFSRAEFVRNVATTSIASVLVSSAPRIAGADDAEDLSMPTAEEQKAQEVSKNIPIA